MAVAVDSTAEIDTDLHHNAVNVLLYIYDQEEETATTTEIKNATGLSSANISGGHAQELERRGLIERTGSVEGKAPINTNVYTTTPRGRKEANRLLKQTDAEVPMPDGEKLALLNLLKENREGLERLSEQRTSTSVDQTEVRELREEVRDVQEQVKEISKRVDENDETLDEVYVNMEDIYNRLSEL